MNNFIIYDNNPKYLEIIKNIIFNIVDQNKLNYNTFESKCANEVQNYMINIHGNKIYILDTKSLGTNYLLIAKKIRLNGDWISPIIIISDDEKLEQIAYTSKILILSFIYKNDNFQNNLQDKINIALKINSSKKTLNFIYKSEIYQIPYEDILYIEKKIKCNSSIIVTKDKLIPINKCINDLETILCKTTLFYKTHQSCIVNTKNIFKVDFDLNIIYFKNCSTDLLSRNRKKGLKNILLENNNN